MLIYNVHTNQDTNKDTHTFMFTENSFHHRTVQMFDLTTVK